MNTSLNRAEITIYFLMWISANLYSLYRLYEAQTEYLEIDPTIVDGISDLYTGWKYLDRLQDVADIEWTTWKFYFYNYWYLCIINFAVSELIRTYKHSLLPYWQILFTSSVILFNFNLKLLLIQVTQPLIYMILLKLKSSRTVIWLVSICLLILTNSLKDFDSMWQFMYDQLEYDEEIYLIFISLSWIELRCISFSLNYLAKQEELVAKHKEYTNESVEYNAIDLLSYALYFPVIFMGPIILFEDFRISVNDGIPKQTLSKRMQYFFINIIIFLSYITFMDFALHYIYFYAMQNDIEYLKALPGMALCGGGLWMGVQFHLKYVINYGVAGSLAQLDHIKAPPTPRCIARIHLYSQMWKYFDVGLYRFLVKYIYIPILATLVGKERKPKAMEKMLATFMTFLFIYIWHGTTTSILIWACLNFLGVELENLSTVIASTYAYSRFKKVVLKSDQMEERFKALMCTPLLAMSAMSNFYLFAGYHVGTIYLDRFIHETWGHIGFVLLCLFSCCQVSSMLQNVSSRTY